MAISKAVLDILKTLCITSLKIPLLPKKSHWTRQAINAPAKNKIQTTFKNTDKI